MQTELITVNDLEEYILCLGTSAVSLTTLFNVQTQALKHDYLDAGEKQLAENIRFDIKRAYDGIQAILQLMSIRTDIDLASIGERIKNRMTDKPKKTKKPRTKTVTNG